MMSAPSALGRVRSGAVNSVKKPLLGFGQWALFIGQVFDAKSSKNLTRERIDQLNKVKFSDLPLNLALKQVKGDGKRVIAVFEDPNCG